MPGDYNRRASKEHHVPGNVAMPTPDPASPPPPSHRISLLLEAFRDGHPDAKGDLVQTIYDELKQLAGSLLRKEHSPDQSLQITDLVQELYLRLEGTRLFERAPNRRYLFGAVHRALRRILADRARRRNAQKRAGGWRRIPLDDDIDSFQARSRCDLVELHEALEKLGRDHPRAATVVDLRMFGDLDQSAIAEMLQVSVSTVEADFRFARALLREELTDS